MWKKLSSLICFSVIYKENSSIFYELQVTSDVKSLGKAQGMMLVLWYYGCIATSHIHDNECYCINYHRGSAN